MRESRERSSRQEELVYARVVRRLLFPVVARSFERRPRNGPERVGRRRDVSGCNALTHSYKYFRNCRKQYVVKSFSRKSKQR